MNTEILVSLTNESNQPTRSFRIFEVDAENMFTLKETIVETIRDCVKEIWPQLRHTDLLKVMGSIKGLDSIEKKFDNGVFNTRIGIPVYRGDLTVSIRGAKPNKYKMVAELGNATSTITFSLMPKTVESLQSLASMLYETINLAEINVAVDEELLPLFTEQRNCITAESLLGWLNEDPLETKSKRVQVTRTNQYLLSEELRRAIYKRNGEASMEHLTTLKLTLTKYY